MFETTKQYIKLYKCVIIVYPSSCKSLWAPNHTQSINTAINHCPSSALKSVASVSFSKSKISLAAMWRSHMSNSPNATSKSRSKLKAIGNENRETKCSLTWSLPSCSKAFTHQVCQRPELPLEWKLVMKSALLPYYHHMWEHASIVSIRSGPNIMYSMYSQQNHVDFPSQKGTQKGAAVVRPPNVLRSHDGCVKTHSAEPARHLRRDIRVTWMMGDMNCYGSYGSFQDSMDFKGVVIPCTPQSSPHCYVSYVITASYVISASQHIAAVQSFNPVSIGSARISANSSESSRPSPLMSAALKRMDLENWLEKDAQPVMSPVMDFWIQPWGIK